MKFGKALETNAESMPEGWRPYVIHYKALKKKINAIVQELDDRGLPSPIIKNLLSKSMNGDTNRMEYSFDGKLDRKLTPLFLLLLPLPSCINPLKCMHASCRLQSTVVT